VSYLVNEEAFREDWLEEQQLIQRVQAGDPVAERFFYDSQVERVYRLAYRMTGDETMAEEFTQDTFIRAFDRISTFEGRSALSTWLHSVAVSVILNGLRKVKKYRSREEGKDDLESVAGGSNPPDHDLKRKLSGAIDTLTDQLRLIFVMHDVEGYKHREIAETLDIPVGTSKARLARAHEQLRQVLGTAVFSRPEEVE
jgi:RNA polymerase sigma-70 factor (ECF subfamily)